MAFQILRFLPGDFCETYYTLSFTALTKGAVFSFIKRMGYIFRMCGNQNELHDKSEKILYNK